MKNLFLCLLLFGNIAHAQVGGPLAVESDTIALWNFDSDTGSDVIDSSGSNNGENFATTNIAIPDIDSSYSLGRQITGANQFIDFGVTRDGVFDFQDAESLSVEAIIRLTGSAQEQHLIFASDQIQLMVLGGKLGGFIRTAAGFRGVVSDNSLDLNTNYRVAMYKNGNTLSVAINGKIVNSVEIVDPIVTTSFAAARVTIGGNIFNQYFPGFIDDVRVSSTSKLELIKPVVTKVLPVDFATDEPRPAFEFTLSDPDSGIDSSSIKVYLNQILQTGLTITSSSITGQMDHDLSGIQANEVKIIVSDNVGNTKIATYLFSYANIGGQSEYKLDEDTLGLWHMNDFSPAHMRDSSANDFHGLAPAGQIEKRQGVFGLASYFKGSDASKMTIPSIKLPSRAFTFEAWLLPTVDNHYEQIIFDSGQIKVARLREGYVRFIFNTTGTDESFESTQRVLPISEQSHLAITWDGSKKENNLKFFIDGRIVDTFDACVRCDLNPFPSIGRVGTYFDGVIDEMRLSTTVRKLFNIPSTHLDQN